MADTKGIVLPVYFVPDESGSMYSLVSELNAGLITLLDAMHRHTLAAAKVRFSIIGFSDTATEHLALTDLRTITALPILESGGGTSYSSAFTLLRAQIESGVRKLRSEGLIVHRPVVFFLTDGVPTESESKWKEALEALRENEFRYHPNIIAFGLGRAVASVISTVATRDEFAFKAAQGSNTAVALTEFFTTFTQSVVTSAQSITPEGGELVVPKPPGFVFANEPLPED
jgi:uncharacterized protein YegL